MRKTNFIHDGYAVRYRQRNGVDCWAIVPKGARSTVYELASFHAATAPELFVISGYGAMHDARQGFSAAVDRAVELAKAYHKRRGY